MNLQIWAFFIVNLCYFLICYFSIMFTFYCFLQKKTCDEQKFDTKKTDGPISSDLKSVKSSPRMSIHAENSLKSGKNNMLCMLCLPTLSTPRNVSVLWTIFVGLHIMKNWGHQVSCGILGAFPPGEGTCLCGLYDVSLTCYYLVLCKNFC